MTFQVAEIRIVSWGAPPLKQLDRQGIGDHNAIAEQIIDIIETCCAELCRAGKATARGVPAG